MRKPSLLLLFIAWTVVFLGNPGYAESSQSCYVCDNLKKDPECSYDDTDLPIEKARECKSDKAIGCATVRLSDVFFRQCQLKGEMQCYQNLYNKWEAGIELANGKCAKYLIDTPQKVQEIQGACAHSILEKAVERAQKEFKGLELTLCFCQGRDNCNDLDMASGSGGGNGDGNGDNLEDVQNRATSVGVSWTLSAFLISVISIWK